jgi:fluoroquinolone transport system permease protein
MIYLIHFRNDIRQIIRDPVMLILLLVPGLVIALIKLLILFVVPILYVRTGFNLLPYYAYILSFTLLLNSSMLGIVCGFLMIDERDGNIAELMSVTPLGRSGYIINRLFFSAVVSVIYSIAAVYTLHICMVSFVRVGYLSLFMAVYAAIIGLILFMGADDKVKGLTFAKALNILTFFAFADLFSLPWLIVFSKFIPAYWITAIIKNPSSPGVYIAALCVFIAWFGLLLMRYWRNG